MSIKGMSTKKLASKILNDKKLFILDVRNESDFANWKIEGKNMTVVNAPYFGLIDGIDNIVSQLPNKNEDVLVVCAKEGSSIYVGEKLAEEGYKQVFYLEGGMVSWKDHLEPVKIGNLTKGGSIYQFIRLGKGCLSYLIELEQEAIIVDPSYFRSTSN